MTEDTFTVMGGHSAAAAHGNHFQQSYTTDSRVLEPVFARLGVKHSAHNGHGRMGTIHNSLAGISTGATLTY
jgi:hypothetical protein